MPQQQSPFSAPGRRGAAWHSHAPHLEGQRTAGGAWAEAGGKRSTQSTHGCFPSAGMCLPRAAAPKHTPELLFCSPALSSPSAPQGTVPAPPEQVLSPAVYVLLLFIDFLRG